MNVNDISLCLRCLSCWCLNLGKGFLQQIEPKPTSKRQNPHRRNLLWSKQSMRAFTACWTSPQPWTWLSWRCKWMCFPTWPLSRIAMEQMKRIWMRCPTLAGGTRWDEGKESFNIGLAYKKKRGIIMNKWRFCWWQQKSEKKSPYFRWHKTKIL